MQDCRFCWLQESEKATEQEGGKARRFSCCCRASFATRDWGRKGGGGGRGWRVRERRCVQASESLTLFRYRKNGSARRSELGAKRSFSAQGRAASKRSDDFASFVLSLSPPPHFANLVPAASCTTSRSLHQAASCRASISNFRKARAPTPAHLLSSHALLIIPRELLSVGSLSFGPLAGVAASYYQGGELSKPGQTTPEDNAGDQSKSRRERGGASVRS